MLYIVPIIVSSLGLDIECILIVKRSLSFLNLKKYTNKYQEENDLTAKDTVITELNPKRTYPMITNV